MPRLPRAPPLQQAAAPPPCWPRALLAPAAMQAPPSGRACVLRCCRQAAASVAAASPFAGFSAGALACLALSKAGCCNPACTNLLGGSGRELKLKKCGACKVRLRPLFALTSVGAGRQLCSCSGQRGTDSFFCMLVQTKQTVDVRPQPNTPCGAGGALLLSPVPARRQAGRPQGSL